MYRNAYQRGLLTIFFSGGANPLNIWDVHTKDGYISRFLDQEIKSMVLEIGGTNVTTSFITCPKVTILDETSTRRRFRVSNFQSTTQILPLCTAMPIGLSDGWNQIQFNLAEFTRRAYKKQFVEVQKLKINANIRLRRIYFAERLLPEDELPAEYKLYFPLPHKAIRDKKTATTADKENVKPSTSQQSVKPANAVPVQEKVASATKVVKASSKASVHSLKKVTSRTSKRSSKVNVESVPEQEPISEQAPEQIKEAGPAVETQPGDEKNVETGNVEEKAPEEVQVEVSQETTAPAETQPEEAPVAEGEAAETPAVEAQGAEAPTAEAQAAEAPAAEAQAAEA